LKTNPDCETLLYDDLASNVSDKAIELLIENIDKLTDFGWITLSYNTNSKAIQLLKNNLDKLKNNYKVLSYTENPYIIDILKENQHFIFWDVLSDNPNIFKLDYEQMKKNFEPLAKEIIEATCNPNRIARLVKQYNFDFEDWFD
jgi:hypoxanthine phosphoribosyltransferase